jgi:hypothetical protein
VAFAASIFKSLLFNFVLRNERERCFSVQVCACVDIEPESRPECTGIELSSQIVGDVYAAK